MSGVAPAAAQGSVDNMGDQSMAEPAAAGAEEPGDDIL